ncbi:hypothetical protein N8T08_009937 [Aspergillus melleus]|uniref:Uncharacterized protein n=1 Tax=Aspergillus melleus TaxID=138277 RepID=A0ACC3ASG1_9EURO|nr:hypothetical protein N8T08_009937 [Aspergillus melleus]
MAIAEDQDNRAKFLGEFAKQSLSSPSEAGKKVEKTIGFTGVAHLEPDRRDRLDGSTPVGVSR